MVCKVLESIVRDHIMAHLADNNMLHKYQFGFRFKRSCASKLVHCTEEWSKAVDNGPFLDVIYVDFRKTFHTVPHRELLTKLASFGINGTILSWISNFLASRMQRVKVGECLSERCDVTSGVPQTSGSNN